MNVDVPRHRATKFRDELRLRCRSSGRSRLDPRHALDRRKWLPCWVGHQARRHAYRTLRRWYTGDTSQIAYSAHQYPQCSSPPDAAAFNAQGMSLRPLNDFSSLLYVSNHGGREAIEIFRIDAVAASEPTCAGSDACRCPPGMAANSVASFADGSILVTVLTSRHSDRRFRRGPSDRARLRMATGRARLQAGRRRRAPRQ